MLRIPVTFVLLFFGLLLPCGVYATTPPALQTAELKLLDGSRHEVMLLGSRSDPYMQLADGRYLKEIDSIYYLADLQDGRRPVAEPEIFGYAVGYKPNAVSPSLTSALKTSKTLAGSSTVSAQATIPTRSPYRYQGGAHEQPLVIVRVAFSDQDFEYSDAEVAAKVFGASNSVSNYFLENSYQAYRIIPATDSSGTPGDGVIRITLDTAHPDFGSSYGQSSRALVNSAFGALAGNLNLAAYDRNADSWLDPSELGVVVLVAGFEQAYASSATSHPRVWAHKSAVAATNVGGVWLSEYAMFGEEHEQHLATVGLMAHELGHLLLDLPDLYDSIGVGAGVGRWGLMSYGTWNTGGGNAGDRPSHLIAWAKELLGFTRALPESTGSFSLRSLSEAGEVVRIDLDKYRHGKRLLIENRQKSGFDDGIPSAGVLITEIDDLRGFGPLSVLTEAHSDLLVQVQTTHEGVDVNTSSGGTIVTSAGSITLAGGLATLQAVSSGGEAGFQLSTTTTPQGYAIGYDELPASASWGQYNTPAYAVITVPLTSDILTVDGIDFFAHGNGKLEVGVYSNLTRFSAEGRVGEQSFNVSEGWNRLLFDKPISVGVDTVYIQLASEPNGSHAPFLVDTQGQASGQTKVKEKLEYAYYTAEFDISAKLLITSSDEPVQRAPVESSSSSSSGGAFFDIYMLWQAFLLLPLLVMRRRKRIY